MQSTLIRKVLMALTGLFICLFLVIHLAGNLQLLLPPERALTQFNLYSRILSGNLIIKAVSYLLFASILAHTAYALIITIKNREASGGKYAYDRRGGASKWYSRSMGLLGSIILVFLISHLKDFWFPYTFGSLPLDTVGNKDLFTVVVTAYQQWWYVLLNVVAFIALGYHLLHGFKSAFKTLGAYPNRLSKLLHYTGIVFSLLMSAGYIFIVIFVYLTY
jgi:succinate dehydrogenase / fumarate reductase cytochrome b subunit